MGSISNSSAVMGSDVRKEKRSLISGNKRDEYIKRNMLWLCMAK
jgi:hypothetical protein